MFTSYIHVKVYTHLCHIFLYSVSSIPIEVTATDNCPLPDDPNNKTIMVSHCDCKNQHNLRQFNLLNVKPRPEAPSKVQQAKFKAAVYVRAKAKCVTAFKCEADAKKKRKK